MIPIPGALLHLTLAGGCDTDGDGAPELFVGVPDHVYGPERVFLLEFADGAVSEVPSSEFEPPLPSSIDLGSSVVCLGDVDGDGLDDLAAVAPEHASIAGFSRTYYFEGGSDPLGQVSSWTDDTTQAASAIGDVDGDGHPDLLTTIIGGFASVRHGRWYGIDWTQTWTPSAAFDDARFGVSEATGIGDLDGDGYADVAMAGGTPGSPGALGAGSVYIYRGGPSGLAVEADWTLVPERSGSMFGVSIAGVGDVDGDGLDEFLVAAPFEVDDDLNDVGAIHLFGLEDMDSGEPSWSWFGPATPLSRFGSAVAGVGDLDGDGYADFAATGVDGKALTGYVAVWRGGAGTVAEAAPFIGAAIVGGSTRPVVALGDLDSDGYDDFGVTVIGNPSNPWQEPASIHVYYGGPEWGPGDDDDAAPDDDDSAGPDDDDTGTDDDDSGEAPDDDDVDPPPGSTCACSAQSSVPSAMGLLVVGVSLMRRRRSNSAHSCHHFCHPSRTNSPWAPDDFFGAPRPAYLPGGARTAIGAVEP